MMGWHVCTWPGAAGCVGRLPCQRTYARFDFLAHGIAGNVEALLADKELPFTGVAGPTSSMQAPTGMAGPRQAAPRDHA